MGETGLANFKGPTAGVFPDPLLLLGCSKLASERVDLAQAAMKFMLLNVPSGPLVACLVCPVWSALSWPQ